MIISPLPRAEYAFSVSPNPSTASSRKSPGRSKPWPALPPHSRLRRPCRNRRRRRPSWRRRESMPSWSTGCAGCLLPCWRLPQRHRPPCSRLPTRRRRDLSSAARRAERVLPSWPCSRARDRQAVGDIGEVVLDVAVLVVLRIERHAAHLAVAGDEAAAGGAHAGPFRTVDRQRIHDAERGRQHFGADALARALHIAGGAGEVELAAAGVEIFLALLVGRQRARMVRNLDIHRLAARGEGHVGRQRRHLVTHIGVGRLAIGLAALIEREFERDHLALLLVEVRIILANADALVREAVFVGLAVLERLGEHLLAGLDRELVRRELLLLHPLLVQALVHRIGTVDEIFRLQLGELFVKELLERLAVRYRIDLVGGSRGRRESQRAQRQRGQARKYRTAQLHHPIFAVVESVAPLLSIQLTLSSSPFLPPLKANLT